MLQRECQWSLMYAAQQQPPVAPAHSIHERLPCNPPLLSKHSGPLPLPPMKPNARDFLQRLFPHHSVSILDMVLDTAGGDVHRAIEHLVSIKPVPPPAICNRIPLTPSHHGLPSPPDVSPVYVPWSMPPFRANNDNDVNNNNAKDQMSQHLQHHQRYASLLSLANSYIRKPKPVFHRRSAFSPIKNNVVVEHSPSKLRCASVDDDEDDEELICVDVDGTETDDVRQRHSQESSASSVITANPKTMVNTGITDSSRRPSKICSNSTPKLSFSVDFLLGRK